METPIFPGASDLKKVRTTERSRVSAVPTAIVKMAFGRKNMRWASATLSLLALTLALALPEVSLTFG